MHGVRLASLVAATVILIPSSLFVASSASAQMRCTRAAAMLGACQMESGTQAEDGTSQSDEPTRSTPAMRERVYQALVDAQALAEEDDLAGAMEELEDMRGMRGLNSYETAQIFNFMAFIYFGEDNYPEAIRSYETVLEQDDLPLGMEVTTRFTLCQLYFQQERYEESLAMLDEWFEVAQFVETPGPEPFILRAQILYQMQRYEEGVEPVLTAIQVAEFQEKPVQENWFRLLNVFYYELEDYPNVIDVLRLMIETWPKREYFIQLSALYGQEGEDAAQLALYEVAYEAGWLTQSNTIVQLGQLLLGADVPVKAAKILDEGLSEGTIESTEANWRTLAQAWQLAQEDEKAVGPLTRAAGLAEDGILDVRLAQSYSNLEQWENCVEAAREGIRKGELRREDQANMVLGSCLFELKEYGPARTAFNRAAEDERSRTAARGWVQYVNSEEDRDQQLAAALAR
ncbi:MAG: hypothetical protein VX690_05160 [Pseudomonadota bacterium]|jgi:tetratricopeptide (TPR) repeat protein|nr:hypothetical protein [Pseudomonadota bacterium]